MDDPPRPTCLSGKSPAYDAPSGSGSKPLNPEAAPFTPSQTAGPSRSPEGIWFRIPSSVSDEEEEFLWSTPRTSSKGKAPLVAEDATTPPRC